MAGVRATEAKQHGPGDFYNVDDTPAWHEMASFYQRSRDRLREKEREFINDVASRRSGASQPSGNPNGCALAASYAPYALEKIRC
jgi:hypothetical protein